MIDATDASSVIRAAAIAANNEPLFVWAACLDDLAHAALDALQRPPENAVALSLLDWPAVYRTDYRSPGGPSVFSSPKGGACPAPTSPNPKDRP